MRIIVAGAGEIGSHLAKMLSMEYHEITVISPDEESLERISGESDIITVEGISSSIETLQKARIANADLFIAVNPDSEQDINIVSSILAKKLGAKKVTARINNEEYQKNENRILFTDLGIDSLFYPEKIAATEIVNLLKQNTASEFMNYSHGKLQLIVYKLEECSPMVDRTVAELRERTLPLCRHIQGQQDHNTQERHTLQGRGCRISGLQEGRNGAGSVPLRQIQSVRPKSDDFGRRPHWGDGGQGYGKTGGEHQTDRYQSREMRTSVRGPGQDPGHQRGRT